MQDVYQEQGFQDRNSYLRNLAEQFGLDPETVFMVANLYGSEEDFDRLILELEDIAMQGTI